MTRVGGDVGDRAAAGLRDVQCRVVGVDPDRRPLSTSPSLRGQPGTRDRSSVQASSRQVGNVDENAHVTEAIDPALAGSHRFRRRRRSARRHGPQPGSSRGTPRRRVTCAPYSVSSTAMPRTAQLALDPAGVGVVEVERCARGPGAAQRAGCVETGADRVAVRPDQAAGAEQGAAEPAGDDRDTSLTSWPREHLQHRGAGGAGRLAVVGSSARPRRRAPSTKAEQWCRASQCCLRSRSTTARAASSSSTRASVQRKRERLTSISASASPGDGEVDVTTARAPRRRSGR